MHHRVTNGTWFTRFSNRSGFQKILHYLRNKHPRYIQTLANLTKGLTMKAHQQTTTHTRINKSLLVLSIIGFILTTNYHSLYSQLCNDPYIQVILSGPYHYDPDSLLFCHRKSAPNLRDTVICTNECEECCLYNLQIEPHWPVGSQKYNNKIIGFELCTDWGGCKNGTPLYRPCNDTLARGCIPSWNHICEFCDPHKEDDNGSYPWQEICANVLDTNVACTPDTVIILPKFPKDPPDTIITLICDTSIVSHLCDHNCLHLGPMSQQGNITTKTKFHLWFGITGECCDTNPKCVWMRLWIKDGNGNTYAEDCQLPIENCFSQPCEGKYIEPCDSNKTKRKEFPPSIIQRRDSVPPNLDTDQRTQIESLLIPERKTRTLRKHIKTTEVADNPNRGPFTDTWP